MPLNRFDVTVIGGGFYGCSMAAYAKRCLGAERVLVIERESELMQRASYVNQARLHNGYHYPRSFTTAYRSRINFLRFVTQYPECVVDAFDSLYCIARSNSSVSTRQFIRFCNDVGAPLSRPRPYQERMFSRRTVDSVFRVQEFAFDARILSRLLADELQTLGIAVALGKTARTIDTTASGDLALTVTGAGGAEERVETRMILNCTYAALAALGTDFHMIDTALKYELTEIALIEVPTEMQRVGVTIMDGPFFSTMPFPSAHLHSLSHVRYTPHRSWLSTDAARTNGPAERSQALSQSRAQYMLRDAARYLPAMSAARHVRSLFEVKTILAKNEIDDGRPILFEPHRTLPRTISILGGKIDNVYDVQEMLKTTALDANAV